MINFWLVMLTIVPVLSFNYTDTLMQGDADTLYITATDSQGVPLDSVNVSFAFSQSGIVEFSDTVIVSDSSGKCFTSVRASNPGRVDVYVTSVNGTDTAFDTLTYVVLDSTMYFYMSVYPENNIVHSDESDTIYAHLSSRDSLVAGRAIYFHVVSGSGRVSPLSMNTDVNGYAYTVFEPYVQDTVFIEGYFLDNDNRKIADTARVIVLSSEADTQRAFADSLFFYPSPLGQGINVANIEYLVPSSISSVEIRILDPFGNTVYRRSIMSGQTGAVPGEWNRIQWDGKNDHGKKVASGMYILVVRIYRNTALLRELVKRVGVEW